MRPLATEIALSTAHRPIRDKLAARVLSHPQDVEEVLRLAFSTREANHHKACWVLELVLEEKIEWLNRHLEVFTQKLALFSDPRGRRSISKICLFTVTRNLKTPGFLAPEQESRITEACFDWIIDPSEKVANKAYSIRALYLIGTKHPWILKDLQPILENEFSLHSAAYKAVAREVLPKIKKLLNS